MQNRKIFPAQSCAISLPHSKKKFLSRRGQGAESKLYTQLIPSLIQTKDNIVMTDKNNASNATCRVSTISGIAHFMLRSKKTFLLDISRDSIIPLFEQLKGKTILCTVVSYQNESCLACPHPPLSYEGGREQISNSHFD